MEGFGTFPKEGQHVSSKVKPLDSVLELIDNREFKIGEVYFLNDQFISIPDEDRTSKERNVHDRRPVVVTHSNSENCNHLCPVITVAPLSHRIDLKRTFDLRVCKGKDGLLMDSLVRLRLMQPVLKVDLEKFQSRLSEPKIEELVAMQLIMLGIEE